MKSLDLLTKDEMSKVKLIAFDSDGVLAQKGTDIHQSPGFYSQKTNLITPEVLSKLNILKQHFKIIINSGRNSLYLTQIYQDILWDNVTLISEIGAFITGGGYHFVCEPLNSYELATIVKIRTSLGMFLNDPRVEGFESKQFLTTLHCHEAIPEIEFAVKEIDTQHSFYCQWNEEAYDINPLKFTKSRALTKLKNMFNLIDENILTVGNGINDSDLTSGKTINISTDPAHLTTDDFGVEGEHLGAVKILDHLISLL